MRAPVWNRTIRSRGQPRATLASLFVNGLADSVLAPRWRYRADWRYSSLFPSGLSSSGACLCFLGE